MFNNHRWSIGLLYLYNRLQQVFHRSAKVRQNPHPLASWHAMSYTQLESLQENNNIYPNPLLFPQTLVEGEENIT